MRSYLRGFELGSVGSTMSSVRCMTTESGYTWDQGQAGRQAGRLVQKDLRGSLRAPDNPCRPTTLENFSSRKNEASKRGPKLETNFRSTNFFSPPPPPFGGGGSFNMVRLQSPD